LQLPIAASSRPRLTSAGSNDDGVGGSTAAMAGRHVTANAATAPTITIAAMTPPMIRDDAMALHVSPHSFFQAGSSRRIVSTNSTAERFTKGASEQAAHAALMRQRFVSWNNF
jgi:hypothetical protein